jgi:hypothetical protein
VRLPEDPPPQAVGGTYRIAEALKEVGQDDIVDLGSGAMGPIRIVVEELETLGWKTQTTLTDLYPPSSQLDIGSNRSIRYLPERLMRELYHDRFPECAPCSRPSIISDLRTQQRFFETHFFVLVMTPTIRPRSVFQLLFTYLVPVLPLMIFWDGFVSRFSTYSPEEMLAMTASLNASDYRWRVGNISIPGLPVAVPYLIGCPVTR